MSNEADTCRKYVVPKLTESGWDDEPHSIWEQKTFTDGRIVVAGNKVRRRPQKRADYLLRYTRDFLLAVVEAKADYKTPGDGLQQAKEYAEILGLNFAYSTNGEGIIEFDYLNGTEKHLEAFPTPGELWERLRGGQGWNDTTVKGLLTPIYHFPDKDLRYYNSAWSRSRTTQRRRFAPSTLRPSSYGDDGQIRRSGPTRYACLRKGGSASKSWPRPPTGPRPIPLTCSVT